VELDWRDYVSVAVVESRSMFFVLGVRGYQWFRYNYLPRLAHGVILHRTLIEHLVHNLFI
jgi:hypothetical protein